MENVAENYNKLNKDITHVEEYHKVADVYF